MRDSLQPYRDSTPFLNINARFNVHQTFKDGVAADRIVSVHDPEMRHGRKSAAKRFDGHKAAVAVDPESQLIAAAVVLPGNAQDRAAARELVEQTEANAEVTVTEAIGDCTFGDGATRQEFADAGRRLVVKVPPRPNGPYFAKEDFQIDPVAQSANVRPGTNRRRWSRWAGIGIGMASDTELG